MTDTDLPTGTITMLFTDIEGSTRLLQQLGEKYAAVLARHHQLLREACDINDGRVVDAQGDAFFMAFSGALEAVSAAVQSQRALVAEPWPEGLPVRVRMGLHTGEPQLNASDYVGLDVHRAARIAAAGHGGQVLLSQTTYDLVEGHLPAGVTVRDLGEHRLKDLRRPKQLYQLVIAGLPSEFPPVKSLDGARSNLPLPLTRLVGRSQELEEVKQLLVDGRLVTLTGPGGSGKTRLALQCAAESAENFPAGVFFVALAPIAEPGLVASTIAQSLGLTETAGRSILDRLKDYLRGKALLLVLDNFEQVIAAAPVVAELLAACSQVKILATSREGLHLNGERLYAVPPLALPNLGQLPALDALARNAAVELFVERAQAVQPSFRMTNESAPAVAEICFRLDGLPLAIELAAARVKLMPPRALLARLGDRLEFLTGGRRDSPERQQTLRNAIAWSYDLLDEQERKLFRRLSVFVGGATLEAVEAVAGDPAAGSSVILDQLSSLLDKSLLRQVEGAGDEPRFVMLEMLREFGREALQASGEATRLRQWHANFFLALAEQAEASLEGAEQVPWLERMEQEHDNLRAALDWSLTSDVAGSICWRLAAALGLFWEMRGHLSEGRARLAAILSQPSTATPAAARAKLLARAAELAYRQSDYPATLALAGESLEIARSLGDRPGMASMLLKLANAATETGDYVTASARLAEALALWRDLDDKPGIARALVSLGWAALRAGNYPEADARLQEALTLSRELGDTRRIAFELAGLGEVALRQGDDARATRLVEDSLALRVQLNNKWGLGVSLGTLGWLALRAADWARARSRLGESLDVRREIGDSGGCAWCLERLAQVAAGQGQPEKAARLLGAAAELRSAIGSVIDPADQGDDEARRARLRAELGEATFAAAWEAGRALTLEQAAAQALENHQ